MTENILKWLNAIGFALIVFGVAGIVIGLGVLAANCISAFVMLALLFILSVVFFRFL